ncbi:MAG TPA: ArsA family ATPase [Solirubrobacteraceae bacterium]|jgi:anion-transporting  ArsA/GET3 family ATPase|nr:ArsA family ATPase [Solirubrobacteraceae bacterium]
MASLLERKLIVVTGKGGAGKTTVASALGLLAARRGLRTIVVELGDQHRLPALFDHSRPPQSGAEIELEANLWGTSIDPDRALLEWLRTVGGRISVRMLAASSTFHYFAAAAPGAKELVSMIKVLELCESERQGKDRESYDLVVLDAPATGHALAMLRSPQTFAAIVKVGPLAERARDVRRLLGDPLRTAFLAVAQGTEMAITETLELEEGLRRDLDRDLDAVVVNSTVPRRFTREELRRISIATGDGALAELNRGAPLVQAAVCMAHTAYERSRVQQSQIARLRRQRFARGSPPSVLTVPLAFKAKLDLSAVRTIAEQIQRKL